MRTHDHSFSTTINDIKGMPAVRFPDGCTHTLIDLGSGLGSVFYLSSGEHYFDAPVSTPSAASDDFLG